MQKNCNSREEDTSTVKDRIDSFSSGALELDVSLLQFAEIEKKNSP